MAATVLQSSHHQVLYMAHTEVKKKMSLPLSVLIFKICPWFLVGPIHPNIGYVTDKLHKIQVIRYRKLWLLSAPRY